MNSVFRLAKECSRIVPPWKPTLFEVILRLSHSEHRLLVWRQYDYAVECFADLRQWFGFRANVVAVVFEWSFQCHRIVLREVWLDVYGN